MASIERLKNHPKVEHVADERGLGNGVIVTLKQGWSFEPACDNRVRGEETLPEICTAVKHETYQFAGPYDA